MRHGILWTAVRRAGKCCANSSAEFMLAKSGAQSAMDTNKNALLGVDPQEGVLACEVGNVGLEPTTR